MIRATSKFMSDVLGLGDNSKQLSAQDVAGARQYIADYWPHLVRSHKDDTENLIGLPHPFLVPSYDPKHDYDFDEMYYWDSYFMVQGMYNPQNKELVVGILENLLYMFQRFKIIPNASQLYMTSRSQPPFLTSFIWEVYEAYDMGVKWLGEALDVAQQEYRTVWMGTKKPNARLVHDGLSRYYDFNYLNDIAEAESGWDMTTRFGRKCLNYLPVDLNALLYKYEADFARYYELVEDAEQAKSWKALAKARAKAMDKLMWDKSKNFYYDYNYVKDRRSNVTSLAGFYPMWAGMVTPERAKVMTKSLRKFMQKGGLSTTDAPSLNQRIPGTLPTQWAYPNGWAPLHLLVVRGLERYGFHDQAKQVAMRWLACNLSWFNQHKEFLEKYNVVAPDKLPNHGVYPAQTGFGWTNAVFERFCQDYIDETV